MNCGVDNCQLVDKHYIVLLLSSCNIAQEKYFQKRLYLLNECFSWIKGSLCIRVSIIYISYYGWENMYEYQYHFGLNALCVYEQSCTIWYALVFIFIHFKVQVHFIFFPISPSAVIPKRHVYDKNQPPPFSFLVGCFKYETYCMTI